MKRRLLGGGVVALLCALGCSDSPSSDGTGTAGAGGTAGTAGTSGSAGAGADAGPPFVFEPLAALAAPPDVTTDRLCRNSSDPDSAPDKTFIDCDVEGDQRASAPPPKSEIVVMSYNIERGLRLDEIIAAFESGLIPTPDVLLASELDRGCSRTANRDVTRDLAVALDMNYVFAVEFMELPRGTGGGGEILELCEHGNAILSKYPLGNVGAFQHTDARSWYIPPADRGMGGEPRLGGRVLLFADVQVGDKFLHTYSLHFESEITALDIQAAQAVESAEHGLAQPFQVVQGGDTNAGLYIFDLMQGTMNDGTSRAYLDRGYVDAHAGLPSDQRLTRPPFILDIIFTDEDFVSSPGICSQTDCGSLSDHVPVWTTVTLD